MKEVHQGTYSLPTKFIQDHLYIDKVGPGYTNMWFFKRAKGPTSVQFILNNKLRSQYKRTYYVPIYCLDYLIEVFDEDCKERWVNI